MCQIGRDLNGSRWDWPWADDSLQNGQPGRSSQPGGLSAVGQVIALQFRNTSYQIVMQKLLRLRGDSARLKER
jgi:hypothetical protein